jgi:uncharacterized membrane protein YqhA
MKLIIKNGNWLGSMKNKLAYFICVRARISFFTRIFKLCKLTDNQKRLYLFIKLEIVYQILILSLKFWINQKDWLRISKESK